MLFVRGRTAKLTGLAFSLVPLLIAVVVAIAYNTGAGMQFVENVNWIPAIGAHYALGVDGIGLTLVLLTAFLTPVVIIAAWNDPDLPKPGEVGAAATPRWGAHAYVGL